MHDAAEYWAHRELEYNRPAWANMFAVIRKRVNNDRMITDLIEVYATVEIRNKDESTLILRHPKHFERNIDWIRSVQCGEGKYRKRNPANDDNYMKPHG